MSESYQTTKPDCEYFELLVSALLDDELDTSEQLELDSHLKECRSCSELATRFASVNQAVGALSDEVFGQGATTSPDLPMPAFLERSSDATADRRHRWPVWSMIPIAVVATVLICLLLIALPNGEPVSAEQISPAEIVDPIRELHLIHSQQQRDQELMLSTLGMDLRSLKLDLNRLEPGSPERENLAKQIDAMLLKVKLFSSKTESDPQPTPQID